MFIASMVKDGSSIATQVLRHTAMVKVDLQKGIDKHIDADWCATIAASVIEYTLQ